MTPKQLMWNRAAEFVSDHAADFENINGTETRRKLVGEMYREFLKWYVAGIDVGCEMYGELAESETVAV